MSEDRRNGWNDLTASSFGPPCQHCKHLNAQQPWRCAAYPVSIPYAVFSEGHNEVRDDQELLSEVVDREGPTIGSTV